MKKYLVKRLRFSALLLAGAFGTLALVTPQWATAQSAPEKIRLMADTLRARDSGDLDLAKNKAEELIKIAPNDENVQRLLASINRDLERRGGSASSSASPVFGQSTDMQVEAVMEQSIPRASGASGSSASGNTGANAVVQAAAADQDTKIAAAESAIGDSKQLAELGAYADAMNLLNAASNSLTLNTATARTLDRLEDAKAAIVLEEARALANAGDLKAAESKIEEYRAAGGDSAAANSLARSLDKQISDPYELDINEISPEYVEQTKVVRDLLTRGRAQYLNGDYDGAKSTFREVEARDANNAEAKLFQQKIAEILGEIHKQNHYKTREQMLTEVDQNWERPKVFDITRRDVVEDDAGGRIQDKLNGITIPQVNFSGMELTRVIETLSELSVEYDPERVGVNIVPLFNPNDLNPRVNISLRNLNLDRILQFVTQQVNFAYDVGGDAVTVQPSSNVDGISTTLTEFFPISRATVIRLTGFRDGGGSSSGPVDPFAAPSTGSSGPSQNEEVEALRNFFQSAGVNFDLPGATLAFDGDNLIVTQSRRNLERIRNILRSSSNEIKQVEIESKFLEVSQNDLDEIGFDWTVKSRGGQDVFNFDPRSLSGAFGGGTGDSAILLNPPVLIDGVFTGSIPSNPPQISGNIDLGAAAGNLLTSSTGWNVNGYDVDFAIRALARKTGSDLMSAPKITVLDGRDAIITVAQEFIYPTTYGDIESEASTSSGTGGGGGGSSISITAGTPQDFETRNVGVEMSVTPSIGENDTITLDLNPRVTEFEGFVEYGGPSVAITESGTTAVVPAGFYQPIFSTREISTTVTIFDGATIVMGGLTRDEVKSVNDKVPVLGDIPGLGRLFRSEGETRQKRNLLIFVTANLVSPGGSPARQNYRNVSANSLFQNPTIMTPAGSVNRSIDTAAE